MDLSERLKSLPEMDKPALCKLWSELFKEPIPLGVRRELLVRILAYRLQEQALGGLSPASRCGRSRPRLKAEKQTELQSPSASRPELVCFASGRAKNTL